jgi:hypothetical protein
LALASAGSSNAARIAMMALTTSYSMSVIAFWNLNSNSLPRLSVLYHSRLIQLLNAEQVIDFWPSTEIAVLLKRPDLPA